MSRRRAAALLAALSLTAGGCGEGDDGSGTGAKRLTAYVSAPLRGERAIEGKAIVNGAKLALADAGGRAGPFEVRALYLDDSLEGRWSPVRTAANARRAAEDSSAIGYIGDLDSGATRVSLPITNQAEMIQISPGSTAVDLTQVAPVGDAEPQDYRPSDKQTFARLVPEDEVQARAAALWAKRLGARRVDSLSDEPQVASVLVEAFLDEATRLGLGVAATAPTDPVYYAGGPSGFARALRLLPRRPPISAKRPLIASDAVFEESLRICSQLRGPLYVISPFRQPHELVPRANSFNRAYRARFGQPDAAGAYGYEAMALLLDAIDHAGDREDIRDAVIEEVLSTSDRDSIIGRYSIDGNGDTTLDFISVFAVRDCRRSFARELRVP